MRERGGRQQAGRRGGASPYRRLPWIGAGILAAVVGITIFAADGAPPSSRLAGAGIGAPPCPTGRPQGLEPARRRATPRKGDRGRGSAAGGAAGDPRGAGSATSPPLRAELDAAQRAPPGRRRCRKPRRARAARKLTRLVPAMPSHRGTPSPAPTPAEPALRIVLHHFAPVPPRAPPRRRSGGAAAGGGAGGAGDANGALRALHPVVRYFHDGGPGGGGADRRAARPRLGDPGFPGLPAATLATARSRLWIPGG